jgi:hypothetical protein
MARNAVHPNDHRNHEDGGQQKHEAFEAVFVDLKAIERNGYGQAERACDGHACPDKAGKVGPASASQINEYDANDEGSFDAFTERNEKGREQK